MDRYQLFGHLTATANNAANVQIVRAGRIRRIDLIITSDMDADGEGYFVEISLQNTAGSGLNNSRGVLAMLANRKTVVTSGGGGTGQAMGFDLDVPVAPLDFVYMNCGVFLNETFPAEVDATALITVM